MGRSHAVLAVDGWPVQYYGVCNSGRGVFRWPCGGRWGVEAREKNTCMIFLKPVVVCIMLQLARAEGKIEARESITQLLAQRRNNALKQRRDICGGRARLEVYTSCFLPFAVLCFACEIPILYDCYSYCVASFDCCEFFVVCVVEELHRFAVPICAIQ